MAKQAILTYVEDENGEEQPVFVDPETGEALADLEGYELVTTPTEEQTQEVQTKLKSGEGKRSDSPSGFTGKSTSKDDATNNFGYQRTPLGVKAASFVPGPVGMAAKVVNLGLNAKQVSAVSKAKEALGMPPSSTFEDAKGLLMGNKGVLGPKDIAGKTYQVSIGDALTKDKKTTLTFTEAKTREALKAAQDIPLAAPVEQVEKAPLGTVADQVKSQLSTELGTKIGSTETLKPDQTKEALTPETSEMTSPTSASEAVKGIESEKKDYRTPIAEVDFTKVSGLEPNFAATLNAMRDDAVAQGLNLGVDLESMVRTAEEQKAIKDAGYSKTNTSYHMAGVAADISPMDATEENGWNSAQWDAKHALAEKYGFKELSPSWDPAHIQPNVGVSAAGFMNMPKNEYGVPQVTPDVALGIRGNVVPTPYAAEDVVHTEPNVPFDGFNPYQATPAQFSAMGFTPRTQDEKDLMAKTLAGELDPKTLAGLEQDDPTAIAEFANVMTSIENRTAKTGSINKTLNASQYNALANSNTKVTMGNYKQYGSLLSQKIDGYYAGQYQPTDWSISSYYNPSLVTPDWAKEDDFQKTGFHAFGTVAPFESYSEDFYAEREQYADSINSVTPEGYAGPFGNMGRTDTPSSGTFGETPSTSTPTQMNTVSKDAGSATSFGRMDTPSSGNSMLSKTVSDTLAETDTSVDTSNTIDKADVSADSTSSADSDAESSGFGGLGGESGRAESAADTDVDSDNDSDDSDSDSGFGGSKF